MKNKDLFKEAIADAKSVREVALINAKKTIEEAFAPKIQEMFDNKISEMDDDYSDPANDDNDDLDEDFDLSSILAELDDDDSLMEGEGDDELDEVKDSEDKEDDDIEDKDEDDKEPKSKSDKPKEPKSPKLEPSKPTAPKDDEDLDVSDLSVDDFKKLISDIISQQLGGDNDGISLDDHPEDNLDADPSLSNAPADVNPMGGESPDDQSDDDEDFNLDELLGELDGLDSSNDSDDLDEVKAELREAVKVIKIQSIQIKEQLLLNEKLRGITRLLNKSNLNTAQKVKIIETFDKAKTVGEAKLVYESLKTSFLNTNSKPVSPIKESLFRSSASKVISGTKPAIVNVDAAIARMQKLANIK